MKRLFHRPVKRVRGGAERPGVRIRSPRSFIEDPPAHDRVRPAVLGISTESSLYDGQTHEPSEVVVVVAKEGRTMARCSTLVLGMLLCAALQGCAGAARQPAVPMDRTTEAVPLGVPNARYFVDGDLSAFTRDAMKSMERERAMLAASGKAGEPLPPINFLAISGGGDDGAFGAGLLNGWTAAGTRPEFKAVTGISTGGLIAPFAFLGSRRDKELREVYTSVGPRDIYQSRSVWAAVTNDAMADNRPLWNLLAKYITA